MCNHRLGCFTGTGILAALITALVITGVAFAHRGLLYNPGPLNSQVGTALGGVRSHAETGDQCEACHTAPWEPATMADRCAVCHADIAAQMRDVSALHGRMAHDNPDLSCRHCHPEHRGPAAPLTRMEEGTFPHEAVRYSLNGHQFTVARRPFRCDDCHRGDVSTFDLVVCQDCHRQIDVGFAQTHVLSFGTSCLNCHDGKDTYGDDFNHDASAFPLDGKHAQAACSKCHLDARTIADLQSAPQDCFSCHRADDPHAGRFGQDCGTCHSPEDWKPARFDHNLSAFKLEGKHVEVTCEQCHQNGVYQGAPADCYSCHRQDDEHAGAFGTDCSACHNPSGWEDVNFDHNRTALPLTGGHAGLACERCHQPGQFVGLSAACASCHSDPAFHAGAFGSNCSACHNTEGWSPAKFGLPHPGIADEGGRGIHHGGASCRTCHPATVYRATCSACHDSNNPEGGGGEGGGGDD